VLLLASMAMAAAVTACADDGRDLAAPGPDQTTTMATTPAETTTTAVAMRVTSGSFADGTPIAVENTCAGEDIPPMLTWTGVPMGTAELAVVVRDLDAGGFVHWVVAGIPAQAAGVGGDALPQDAVEALNDFGRPGWAGPCPPSGTHHYEFRVYALAQPSGLQAGAASRQAAEQIEASPATATAVLSGTASAPTA
jgi:Raf kinase inhibitor-like YbhB/YbcL family protein